MARPPSTLAGKRLRDLIAQKMGGPRQERAFAKANGIHYVSLSNLIRGRSEVRRSRRLDQIAKGLDMTKDGLLAALFAPAGAGETEEHDRKMRLLQLLTTPNVDRADLAEALMDYLRLLGGDSDSAPKR